jgi:hypothetical protein
MGSWSHGSDLPNLTRRGSFLDKLSDSEAYKNVELCPIELVKISDFIFKSSITGAVLCDVA